MRPPHRREPTNLHALQAHDRQQRHDIAEITGEARCPRCRTPLVARLGPRGPCFPCRCRGWRLPPAAP
jgi:hypothetical protein